ncbi:hypothetical protein JXA84_02070 [candidate division WOR-3 bacterium]|nr:hypothetical protein [candidate division WOR-3 bacterium]
MADLVREFITSYSIHLGLALVTSGILSAFYGNILFKYFVLAMGIIIGLLVGALAGVYFSESYVLIFSVSLLGAIAFSAAFFLYRTVSIFFIGGILPFFALLLLLKTNVLSAVIVSFATGLLTVFLRRYLLSAWFSVFGAVMVFFGLLIMIKGSIDPRIYAVSAFLTALCGFWIQFRRRKKTSQKKSDKPNSS